MPTTAVPTRDSTETDDERAEKRNYHQLDKVIVQVDKSTRRARPSPIVMRRMLQRRHNDVTDFEITVPELLLQQEQRTKTIFNVVLGAIASISLIVGGIGIMNIMLASILERIKEIGVRRAVGATQKEIGAQFLSEAVMISLAGGIAGIMIGGRTRDRHRTHREDPYDRLADVGRRGVRRVGRGRRGVRHRAGVSRRQAGSDRVSPLRVIRAVVRLPAARHAMRLSTLVLLAALAPFSGRSRPRRDARRRQTDHAHRRDRDGAAARRPSRGRAQPRATSRASATTRSTRGCGRSSS